MNKLEKAGKPDELPQAWKKAQAGGQQARREFYYQVFLLDPTVAKKEIHKESLERLKVAAYSSTLPAGSTEGATLIKQMQSLKEMVDEEQKALCKATKPHRLWAKNAGFL